MGWLVKQDPVAYAFWLLCWYIDDDRRQRVLEIMNDGERHAVRRAYRLDETGTSIEPDEAKERIERIKDYVGLP